MTNINFDGKLAIVTGGGSGIGASTCQLLSELGASVAVVDINKQSADETVHKLTDKNVYLSVTCDVSKSTEVAALFDHISTNYGPNRTADVLVNNAGIRRIEEGSLLTCSEEDWDRTMAVNLKSMFLMTKEFISRRVEYVEKKGIEKADATIVNVSSIRGYHGYADIPEYNASKGGVLSITQSVAKEWGPKGFRCNAVLPGLVDTPLARAVLTEDDYKAVANSNSLGRICQPREVAQAIAFLASDFSSFVTGSFLEVSGAETHVNIDKK